MAGFWIHPNGHPKGGGGEFPEVITWGMIQGRPTEFKPTKHEHKMEEIINLEETISEVYVMINDKVSKETGKQLSEENFTTALKEKLESMENGTVGVISVNGKEGQHIQITKNDLGLGNVLDVAQVSQEEFNTLKERVDNLVIEGGTVTSVNGMTGEVVVTKETLDLNKVLNETQATKAEFDAHTQDSSIHVTSQEKELWNAKEDTESVQSKIDSATLENMEYTDSKVANKVDKEVGKGLSTEDFTTELKEKLESLTPQEIEQLVTSVNGKIGDVVLNKVDIGLENVLNEKQLTQDDYNTLNTAIDEVRALIHDKVDKEEGKGLSSNDFTKEFKDKLTNLPQPSEMVTSVNGFKGEVFLNHENIGLGNVRNVEQATKAEFDLLKDVVTDNEATLLNKVDKKVGYGLSQENFTPAHKAKLEAIEGNGGGSTPPEDAYVASVNGRTGNVELTSQDVGLNHVLNEEQATKEEFDTHKIATNEALSKKVNIEEGKGLSSNDFTDELKTKLLSVPEDIADHPVKSVNGRIGEVELDKTDIGLENVLNKEQATKEEFNALSTTVSNKVDKEVGKGLSSNDFTFRDKSKLNLLPDAEDIVKTVNEKTPIEGNVQLNKSDIGLSNVLDIEQASKAEFDAHVSNQSIHVTSEEKENLDKIPILEQDLQEKVDKIDGKGLSSNDFTAEYKNKVEEIDMINEELSAKPSIIQGTNELEKELLSSKESNLKQPNLKNIVIVNSLEELNSIEPYQGLIAIISSKE